MRIGLERYHADYTRHETTYYMPDGESIVVPVDHPSQPIAAGLFRHRRRVSGRGKLSAAKFSIPNSWTNESGRLRRLLRPNHRPPSHLLRPQRRAAHRAISAGADSIAKPKLLVDRGQFFKRLQAIVVHYLLEFDQVVEHDPAVRSDSSVRNGAFFKLLDEKRRETFKNPPPAGLSVRICIRAHLPALPLAVLDRSVSSPRIVTFSLVVSSSSTSPSRNRLPASNSLPFSFPASDASMTHTAVAGNSRFSRDAEAVISLILAVFAYHRISPV